MGRVVAFKNQTAGSVRTALLFSLPAVPIRVSPRNAARVPTSSVVLRRHARSCSGLRNLTTVCSAQDTAPSSACDATPSLQTHWFQKTITLPGMPRGCHLITRRIYDALPELGQFEIGLAHIFILHTSASLTINENASPDVLLDLNDSLDRIVPEGGMYRHDDEGSDDMPAHVKSSLMGSSLTLPVSRGAFALGTWQGVYLNEHRNRGGPRSVMVTIQGQKRADGRVYPQTWRR